MNRTLSISIGWPTELLGELKGPSSAVNENYAVVCYENDTTEHAFLVGESLTVAEIVRRWLMGQSADVIDEEVINAD